MPDVLNPGERLMVGDSVVWTSAASGTRLRKYGKVAAVIPAGADFRAHLEFCAKHGEGRLMREYAAACLTARWNCDGGARPYDSLAVLANGVSARRKPWLYRPRASQVEREER